MSGKRLDTLAIRAGQERPDPAAGGRAHAPDPTIMYILEAVGRTPASYLKAVLSAVSVPEAFLAAVSKGPDFNLLKITALL